MPGVLCLPVPAPVSQHPGLLPLCLPPWLPALWSPLSGSAMFLNQNVCLLIIFQIKSIVLLMHFLSFNACVYTDINECTRNVCPAHQQCRNTEGGYQCFDSCPTGLTKAENGACVGMARLSFSLHSRCLQVPVWQLWHVFVFVCDQMWMSARMGVTCAATARSVRTPSGGMVVCVPEGTAPKVWDGHVWVRRSLLSYMFDSTKLYVMNMIIE